MLNKPAGLVCHPTKTDEYSSLVSRIRLYLGPETPVQLINRLDRETSGLVLAAKNHNTATAIRKIWSEPGAASKTYLAIVHGQPPQEEGSIDAPIGRDVQSEVAIKDCVRSDGAQSKTTFRVLKRFLNAGRPFSLLEVSLLTGRKHQIRIHLQHLGHPIVGDKLYGGRPELYLKFVRGELTPQDREELILPFHALHAGRLQFRLKNETFQFTVPAESWFTAFLG